MPALWRPHRELIAYSRKGYANKGWIAPPEWEDVSRAVLFEITPTGLESLLSVPVNRRIIHLSLAPDQAVCIVPAGTLRKELDYPGRN